jgi:L-alanine-DL-glutamate epimerase-like enolase superfamily enzyme
MTAIRGLRTTAVRVPLRVETSFSTRAVRHRDYLLVELVDEDGAGGWGYCYAGTSGGTWLAAAVDGLIAPVLAGRDVEDAEGNWDAVYRELLLLGRRGGLLRALSAVDIAGWDLRARREDVPLWKLLGGSPEPLHAYASGGYYREGDAVANVAAEVERQRARGFRDYKMKVGGLPLEQDVARVAAAREALEPGARLALDANNAWTTVDEALRAAEAFAPSEIWWLEEPFLPDDVAGHAELARRAPMPIATGEIEATHWAFDELIRQEAAAILQADAGVCGGVTEWLRIARSAAAAGVQMAPHWHANLHAQLGPAVENLLTIEHFALEEDVFNFEALVTEPLAVEGGYVRLPETPGLGFDFDPDAVARYRTDER